MIDNNMYWVPTMELSVVAGPRNMQEIARENLRKFSEAGGRVAMGTDTYGAAGTWEVGMQSIEIDLMLHAGMSPMQIIVASTQNAAWVCNLERDLGTIEKGKIADLIVIDGNPLENMRYLKEKLVMVFHNGEIIRNELLQE